MNPTGGGRNVQTRARLSAGCADRAKRPLAVYCFPFNLFRSKMKAVRKSRQPASRRRIGASGWQEAGAALSWYSKHSENGNGCGGPKESNATTKPKMTERIIVMITWKASFNSRHLVNDSLFGTSYN